MSASASLTTLIRMQTLVVQAHPVRDSYNAAIGKAVGDSLAAANRGYRLLRLGQGDAWMPVDLAGVHHLIVVHPTWWGSLPAVLLSHVQAVVAADESAFRDVTRLSAAATHGGSRLINLMQGEPGRRLWQRHVLPLCGPGARFDWIALYRIDQATSPQRRAFLTRAAGLGR